ncbi:MAG: hypothetical protein KC561_20090, partial [Myxococcales bacterium]|nr:hypothetical protein [Myxococcales bacterium]
QLDVQNSVFQKAGIQGVGFNAGTTLGGSRLGIDGIVERGDLTPEGFTVHATAALEDDFVWSNEGTTLTVKKEPGQAELSVTNSVFERVGIDNVGFEVSTTLGESPLTVEGSITTGEMTPAGFTLNANASLKDDFVWAKNGNTLRLKSDTGQATLDVTQSRFVRAGIDNLGFEASTTVGDSEFKVEGMIETGEVTPDGFTLRATADLVPPFEYTRDAFKLKLNSGTAGIDIAASALNEITFDNLQAEVEATVGGGQGPLKLDGALTGGRYASGQVEFNIGMRVAEDYNFAFGAVEGTLFAGGSGAQQMTVDVSANALQSFTFQDIQVLAKTTVESEEQNATYKELAVNGSLSSGGYSGGSFHFNAGLALDHPFAYKRGPVRAQLNGGEVGVDISENALQ